LWNIRIEDVYVLGCDVALPGRENAKSPANTLPSRSVPPQQSPHFGCYNPSVSISCLISLDISKIHISSCKRKEKNQARAIINERREKPPFSVPAFTS
jgi:hypothetical protein